MSWHVVYTQSQKEAVAARNLANQGFEVYLPRYSKHCRHARRKYTVLAPLFPRYLFVRMDPKTHPWRPINGTIGVSYLLTDGNQPTAISREVIDAIAERDDNGVVKLLPPQFHKGQKLHVTGGPFADVEGIFECVDDRERVVLLLQIMGRAVRTRLPGHVVSAA
jgi:transcriptional antiterminator RfaH